MKLSIVTISFNQARYLQACIDSVASQEGDWEHIIIDPGSTDGSREIIDANHAHFSKIIFEPDNGPADGLNTGFSLATGDIGFFLNSDDFLLPGALLKLTRLWLKYPESDLILCSAWRVDEEGKPIHLMRPKAVSPLLLAQGRTTIVQQGMSFKMELFRSVGGFNPDNRTCWDGELLYAFMRERPSVRINFETIGAFRIHGQSLTGGSAGALHESRYQEDLIRIRKTYSSSTLFEPSLNKRVLSAGLEIVANIKRIFFTGLDRIHPRRIAFQWKRDHV